MVLVQLHCVSIWDSGLGEVVFNFGPIIFGFHFESRLKLLQCRKLAPEEVLVCTLILLQALSAFVRRILPQAIYRCQWPLFWLWGRGSVCFSSLLCIVMKTVAIND